jgi:hypothetical protein
MKMEDNKSLTSAEKIGQSSNDNLDKMKVSEISLAGIKPKIKSRKSEKTTGKQPKTPPKTAVDARDVPEGYKLVICRSVRRNGRTYTRPDGLCYRFFVKI